MKYIFIILLCSQLFITNANAQRDTARSKILSFVPQYLVNNGIRIDYEIKLHQNHWIQLCPQFYLSEKKNNENYSYDFNEVAGIGLQAYHKIYLNADYSRLGVYFSYGLGYNFFNIVYDEATNSGTKEATSQINKVGADIIIGYQTIFSQRLVFDIYTGVGGRYSQYKYSGVTSPKFNDNFWGYGYTGNILILGFRLGINF